MAGAAVAAVEEAVVVGEVVQAASLKLRSSAKSCPAFPVRFCVVSQKGIQVLHGIPSLPATISSRGVTPIWIASL